MAKKKKSAQPEPLFGRLCLVTPADADPETFAPLLEAALGAGDVASLIVAGDNANPSALQKMAEKLAPIAQANGVAVIVLNDSRLMARAHADGIHVDTGIEPLREAVEALHPDNIVGAGGITTRHEAMLAAETDCDYIFFGRLDGDTIDAIYDKTFDLAAWWSAVFEIPCIVMGGRKIESVIEAVDARIEFVALRMAVWDHPEGPAAAVEAANRLIAERQVEAAQ
jgi:thiamine-phosphate pyrophosphorylase